MFYPIHFPLVIGGARSRGQTIRKIIFNFIISRGLLHSRPNRRRSRFDREERYREKPCRVSNEEHSQIQESLISSDLDQWVCVLCQKNVEKVSEILVNQESSNNPSLIPPPRDPVIIWMTNTWVVVQKNKIVKDPVYYKCDSWNPLYM